MKHLFVVVYIFGHVAASVGPLPYDMRLCETAALPDIARIQADGWAESIKNGKADKLKPVYGRKFHGPRDIINRCEWHERSPVRGPLAAERPPSRSAE